MSSWITGGEAKRNRRTSPFQTLSRASGGIIARDNANGRIMSPLARLVLVMDVSGGYASLHRRLSIITPLARLRKNLFIVTFIFHKRLPK
ncbi:MAG: hypothetical protein LBK82_16515 [Planctomycetaceae bacterium]|nr:hypothetical protein [Planctomycetaceae bacterium]